MPGSCPLPMLVSLPSQMGRMTTTADMSLTWGWGHRPGDSDGETPSAHSASTSLLPRTSDPTATVTQGFSLFMGPGKRDLTTAVFSTQFCLSPVLCSQHPGPPATRLPQRPVLLAESLPLQKAVVTLLRPKGWHTGPQSPWKQVAEGFPTASRSWGRPPKVSVTCPASPRGAAHTATLAAPWSLTTPERQRPHTYKRVR